jgi:hypothetical protein
MMKRLLVIMAAVAALCSPSKSGIGEWKNFTAMNSVRAVAAAHDSIWAATSGGAFLYTVHDSSFVRFTTSEGLTTNDLTAIAIDRNGAVWFGQSDGSIDIYTPGSGRWRYVRDIAVSTKQQKSITAFYCSGDSIYIASAFGVSLFSNSRFKFIDSYCNFGTVILPPVVSIVSVNGRVFAATAQGMAVSKIMAQNLAAPEAWDTCTTTGAVSSVAFFNGVVLAGGTRGLFTYDGTSWLPVAAASGALALRGQSEAVVYFKSADNIFSYGRDGSVQSFGSLIADSVTCGAAVDGSLVLGTNTRGIAQWQALSSAWKFSAPNGPAFNSFRSVVIDNTGILWCASGGIGGSGHGFYSFDGEAWKNFDALTLPGLTSNACYGLAIGPNNSKWISTWGGGLVLLNGEGKFVRAFTDHADEKFPGFTGIPTDLDYIVPAIVAAGRDGSVWTSIFQTADLAHVVWRMRPDSTWISYSAPLGNYNEMLSVTIDRNDTKWFTNQLPGYPAKTNVVYLNETTAIAGTPDGWGDLTSFGITSPTVFSVVEDREGVVWMGTAKGVTTISDPRRPPSSIGNIYLGAVHDQYINCIAVDPLNNKWVGTSNGVFVLSSDGESLLDQYTVANSNGKLVDNVIYSIAIDTRKGVAYFGTEKGLSSVGIATIAPAANFAGMSVAPNPFRPGDHPFMTIQGLADGSTIKILTASGKLVKEFQAQAGGRGFWDGKTETGETVATGIYVAVAYNENGAQVGAAKMAVIRK